MYTELYVGKPQMEDMDMPEDFAEFITHLTDNARASVQHADAIARGYGSSYIGTEHLLLGLLAQGSSAGAKVLADVDVSRHLESHHARLR